MKLPPRFARWVPQWRLPGLLGAVFFIVVLPFVLAQNSIRSTLEADGWVLHTEQVKLATFELRHAVRDAEAAVYGIGLGLDAQGMHKRFSAAKLRTDPLIDRIRELTRDNPQQQEQLGRLRATLVGQMSMLEQALERFQRGEPEAARRVIADADSLFDFRGVADAVIANEDALMAARKAKAAGERSLLSIISTTAAIAQLVLLGLVIYLSERQADRRVLAERETREAVARARQIVQTVPEPIVLLDRRGHVELYNEAFARLYGCGDEDVRGQALGDIGFGAWKDAALMQRLSDVIARGRDLWDHEVDQTTVDGATRTVMINACSMPLTDRADRAVLITVVDVTSRKQAEMQVSELNRQLAGKIAQVSEVNRELEAFSYSVSHDLRAPLRHIAGFADKLGRHLGDNADDRSAHYLQVIGEAAQRMAHLIDDLLVYSRLGRGAMRLTAVDMQSIVEYARNVAATEAGDRRIDWSVAPLPIVVADENMMRLVWQNLIGNAVKYTGKKPIAEISIGVERAVNGDYVFSVRDNGAGFDMEYAAKLFGVFQRMHKASDFPGTGIGLANVRRIVSRHGGRVWAEAKPEQGAVFYFSIPAQPSEPTT